MPLLRSSFTHTHTHIYIYIIFFYRYSTFLNVFTYNSLTTILLRQYQLNIMVLCSKRINWKNSCRSILCGHAGIIAARNPTLFDPSCPSNCAHTHRHTHTHTHTHAHTFTGTHTNTHTPTCMHVHMHTYTCTQTHIHIHTHTHA